MHNRVLQYNQLVRLDFNVFAIFGWFVAVETDGHRSNAGIKAGRALRLTQQH
jgi:hypothetical protein